ncbi:MAG: LTA synthase family protein [Bacteroidales bacterium]|nr:LTA synthase family protein [Bacteroidales bacterium]
MLPFQEQKERFAVFFKMLNRFASLNLAGLVLLLLLRLGQFVSLSYMASLESGILFLELRGYLQDVVLWLNLSWLLLVPFLLVSKFNRRAGIVFFWLVFLFAAMTEWALFQYFRMVFVPLDQVIFSYRISEMVTIILNSVRVNFSSFLPFILIISTTAVFVRLSLKIRISRLFLTLFFMLGFSALFLRSWSTPKEKEHGDLFEYYLMVNKSAYLISKIHLYRSSAGQTATIAAVEAAARRYQSAHPGFKFSWTRYPFLHTDNTPDVLSHFFNLGREKPNLVFIIVESLSGCFIGNNPIYGSFTPFLDSLAGHSLYWSNHLSTADRTFNVLPALFGSLPPGDPTFVDDAAKIPYHFSLIRYLSENGYFSSFYYAGDPSFNHMEDFLQRQNVDYILRSFGPQFKKADALFEGYHWGHADGDLYARSFDVIDSLKKSPRLDIYLTLSLHAPFIPPNMDGYLARVEDRMKAMDPGQQNRADIEYNKKIFASILYTDHALKEFIDQYKIRDEYRNTIFVITGDHGLPELNLHRFPSLARYHVPLIIYSPMLKRGVFMRSVSSHLDVTPSVLAMMRNSYQIRTRSVAPWLGAGLDTAIIPRNMHTLPVILNNKEIVEYINGSNYLRGDKIYKILPELWLKDTTDQTTLRRMTSELADFKILNSYVTRQNMLVPPEIYFGKSIDSTDIKVGNLITINPDDSTGEYRILFKQLPLSYGIKFLKLVFSIDILTRETDLAKYPQLVMEIYGSQGKQVMWQSFAFPTPDYGAVKQGEWRTLSVIEYVKLSDLSQGEKNAMMLYIWNKSKGIIRLDKPAVKITGYF